MYFPDIVRDTLLLNYTEHAFEFPNCVEASISIDESPDVTYSILFRVDSRRLTVEKAQAFHKFPEHRLIDLTEKWREVSIIRQKIEEIENALSH